jgi:hypothetical protein
VDDGQFFASRQLTPVEGTHADHVFDGECPLSGSRHRMPEVAGCYPWQARFAPRRMRPLTAPGDLRRVAIAGSLGTGDSGENGSLGGRWRQRAAITREKWSELFRDPISELA